MGNQGRDRQLGEEDEQFEGHHRVTSRQCATRCDGHSTGGDAKVAGMCLGNFLILYGHFEQGAFFQNHSWGKRHTSRFR